MEEKIQKRLLLIFSGVFAVIWAVLWLTAASYMNHSKLVCLLAAALLVLMLLMVYLTGRISRSLQNPGRFWRGLSCLLLLLMAAGLFYVSMELKVYPSWDFGSVYQGAVEIAENGAFSDNSNWYFTTYPNNVAVCMLLAGFFKLFGGLCSYITLGILLNIALILLGMVFTFFLAEKLYGSRTAFLIIFCCVLFMPFYMHAPIFYTDTFALPFVTGTFLSYQYRKKDAKWLLLTAAVLAVGYKVKGSLGVILVALLIHLWLQKEKVSERLKKSLYLVTPFVCLVMLLTAVPARMPFFDASDREKNEFPMEHWLAMGLVDSGGYNAGVYWMTASTEGKEAKKEVDRQFIRDTLEEYGVSGMLEHLKDKIEFTWGDGVYFAPEKLKREPVKESPLHSWVLYDGADYSKTYLYCSAVQLLLLAGILLSVLRNFLERGKIREIQAMQLAVFGLFLFLLAWETRSRYLLNFVPVFLLLGVDGAQGAAGWLKRIVPVRRKV